MHTLHQESSLGAQKATPDSLVALSSFGPTEFYQNPKKQTLLPKTQNSSTIKVTFRLFTKGTFLVFNMTPPGVQHVHAKFQEFWDNTR